MEILKYPSSRSWLLPYNTFHIKLFMKSDEPQSGCLLISEAIKELELYLGFDIVYDWTVQS